MTKQYKTQNKARSAGLFDSPSSPPVGRASLLDPAKKFRKVCKWLRDHASNLDYGYKWRGRVIHCNTNAETMDYLTRKRKWLSRITNEKFSWHFSNQDTFYFAGRSSDYSLVMIDIDCHKRGTLQGAKALAASLHAYFPNLYAEVSTNGNGVHGYILVEAGKKTNDELKRLEKNLDAWLISHPHDVEMVEIKGLAPTVTIENRRLTNYKAGVLAKVPREAVERFDELTATTKLTLAELDKVINRIETDCNKPSVIKVPNKMKIVSRAKREKPLGSISGKCINIDRLPMYERFAERFPGSHNIKTSDKHKVTATDIAICLMIVEQCSRNMNVDGSTPTARVKAFWDCMFICGDITRCWNAKRYAAIRNYFSSLGVIDWQDETYRLGYGGDRGQAAKWRFNDAFLTELDKLAEEREEEEEKETPFIDTLSCSSTFIRPREVWIESPQRLFDMKLLDMSNQVLLFYEQAA